MHDWLSQKYLLSSFELFVLSSERIQHLQVLEFSTLHVDAGHLTLLTECAVIHSS